MPRTKVVGPAGNTYINKNRKSIIKYGADEQPSTGVRKEVEKFDRSGNLKKKVTVKTDGTRIVERAEYGGDNPRESFLMKISRKK